MTIERQAQSLGDDFVETDNLLVREDGAWSLQLDDGTRLPLKERQGKELYVLMQAMARYVRGDGTFPESPVNRFDHFVLLRAQCHTILARAIAALTGLDVPDDSPLFERLFRREEFIDDTHDELMVRIREKSETGDVLVLQYLSHDGKRVAHTGLVIRGQGDNVYTFEKFGRDGPLVITKQIDSVFPLSRESYGPRIAVGRLVDIAQSLSSATER